MRLATLNVENLFERASIMNLSTREDGRQTLEDFSRLTDLTQKEKYSEDDKRKIMDIMKRNGTLVAKGESKYINMKMIGGKFFGRRRSSPVEIVANGRDDWIGWFELKRDLINRTAIENTARVIHEINADVFCLVEAESRIAAKRFNDAVIPKVGGQKYAHVMLLEGNDHRAMNVGVMTRQSFEIQSIVSHVDDSDSMGLIFSGDCAEYKISTPLGNTLLVLVNHFQSKGFRSQEENDRKRERQAVRVREIYEERLNQGFEFIIVAGDLNEPPTSNPLTPLLANGSTLIDVMAHNKFTGDGRPGTYATGTEKNKLDYILMSSQSANKVQRGGIERRGVWGGINGTLFPHFPEIKTSKEAASDHAALWVDLDL
jgi:endonuclease/exonuclease/phosphatase family metal-dependent hydrolase